MQSFRKPLHVPSEHPVVTRVACLFLFALTAAVLVPRGLAQVANGNITVVAEDASHAVVQGASATVLDVDNGLTREGKTNERGEFLAPSMPIGHYRVTVQMTGFKSTTVTGLELQVDQTTAVHVVLQPGEVRQQIEVTATAPLLETETSSLGQVVENKKILDLPLNGRNPFALGLLAGNTTQVYGMGTNLPFVGGGGRFSANEVNIDGVDDNTVQTNGSIGRAGIAYTPSVDAVQEFKVKTDSFAAEFGHAAGEVVEATIKSGSNQYHGTLFEFLRNDDLDANNFFANAAGKPKAPFRQNQFGGAVGGPVIHNRTFFFFDYQGTRQETIPGSTISSVPTAAVRSGDFSSTKLAIYDPGTRQIGPTGTVIAQPFPNEVIPQSRINQTSAQIAALAPPPNFGGATALSRNYFQQIPVHIQTDQWDLRMDHRFTDKNNLFVRWSQSGQTQPNPGIFPTNNFLGGGSVTDNRPKQGVISDTHLFSPTLVNEFRFGYARNLSDTLGNGADGVGFAQKAGLALFPFPAQGFPTLAFQYSGLDTSSTEFDNWGGGTSNFNIENHFQWADSLTKVRGNHTIKAGTDFRRWRYESLKGTPFYGQYTFGSTFTSSTDAPGSGAPFADFLLGYPALEQGAQMLDWGRQREIYSGTYIQDGWKVLPRLTINLGLRYELFTQPVDARDRGSLFNVATGQFVIPGQGGASRAMVQADHNNWGPRAGVSYQIRPNLVFRAGYGIFYGLRDQNQGVTQFAGNNPNTPAIVAPVISASSTVVPPFTLNSPIQVAPTNYNLNSFTAASPLSVQIRTVAFDAARSPMVQQMSASFQYEPFQTLLIETSYAGTRGQDLYSLFVDHNQVSIQGALLGQNTQQYRQFPFVNAAINTISSNATSNYNAFNLRIEKRLSHGLNLLANYSVQKNLEAGGSGPSSFIQNGSNSTAMNSFNLARQKDVADIDIPQTFVVSAGYDLPVGHGMRWLGTGALGKIVGGWRVNGILTLRGGFPSAIFTNVIPPTFATYNEPDRVTGVSRLVANPGPSQYINPAAFQVPGTQLSSTGTPIQLFGNADPLPVRGPGSKNMDFSAFKEMFVTERVRLEIRGEFFNLTNSPTFYLPAATSATLTCQGKPGQACNAANPQFGTLSASTATGRQVQFGLKLYF